MKMKCFWRGQDFCYSPYSLHYESNKFCLVYNKNNILNNKQQHKKCSHTQAFDWENIFFFLQLNQI